MAFPAQTIDGDIVNIVDKVVAGGGQLIEVFTDQDGKKYTRDLITAHAAHILVPIERQLELAENKLRAGEEGAADLYTRIKAVAVVAGILDESNDEGESLIEKVGDIAENIIEGVEGAIDAVEDALGIQDDESKADYGNDDGAALPEGESVPTDEEEALPPAA